MEMSEFKKYGHGDIVKVHGFGSGVWAGEDSCVICGRKVGANASSVRFVNGDSEIHAANENDDDIDMAGYMGWWNVGSECAKKFENGVLFKKEGK